MPEHNINVSVTPAAKPKKGVMKRYITRFPGMLACVRAEDTLIVSGQAVKVRAKFIKFQGPYYETDDPELQEMIESQGEFGRAFMLDVDQNASKPKSSEPKYVGGAASTANVEPAEDTSASATEPPPEKGRRKKK